MPDPPARRVGEGSRRVTKRGTRVQTPRSRLRIEAFLRLGGLLAIVLASGTGALSAQEPPDSILAAPDSTLADSTATLPVAEADTASADTIFYNLPELQGEAAPGWASGVWSWDHAEIMASAANTLAELVADVPGVLVLAAGDYGTPLGVTAFGLGGGGIRVLRDGFEVFPFDGGVADLSRIGLGGIARVRLERSLGEVRIEMFSRGYDDGRAYSLVEAGTGDLATNIFRGTFTDPTSLGGSLGFALERADSRGPGGEEVGNRTGTWLRYQLHRGNSAGLAFELRSMGTETEVADYASSVTRTDWAVRGRAELAEGVTGEVYTGRSSHSVDDIRDAYEREGGTRSQHGLRLALSRNGLWARAEHRLFTGGGLAVDGADPVAPGTPSSRTDLVIGAQRSGIGGVSADLGRASWDEETTSARRVRAWTEPVLGLSLFGSWEAGTRGSRLAPPYESILPSDTAQADTTATPVEPDTTAVPAVRTFGIHDRTATRIGAALTLGGATVSGALLKLEADSLIPLGLEPDRGQSFVGLEERKGWEVWGRLPTGVEGLRLEGSLQQWETAGPYLPERIYTGAFVFHRLYKESGNLEWWWSLGVRGHDAMITPIPGEPDPEVDEEGTIPLAVTPFYQDWFATMQVRVVTVQIFVKWENFARRPNLQAFPGRVLPITRTTYGLRWTLWN